MYTPPDPGHYDPKGVRAAADQDYRHDMGLGQDVIHIVHNAFRVVTWPLRMLFRLVRR